MQNSLELFLRIALAGVLAGLIGLEREMDSKEAGLRTHFLVGLASALFMIISKYAFSDMLNLNHVGLDPSRIAAQVVSGISFLGAGTIFMEKKFVKGLTTAAGIWTTAAIGLATGAGLYWIAIFTTFIVIVILKFMQKLLNVHLLKAIDIVKTFDIRIQVLKYPDERITNILSDEKYTISSIKTEKNLKSDECMYSIHYIIKTKSNENAFELVKKIQSIDNVVSVDVENI